MLSDGIPVSEAKEMREVLLNPNYTVGDYMDLMEHDGGIVQEEDKYVLHPLLRSKDW